MIKDTNEFVLSVMRNRVDIQGFSIRSGTITFDRETALRLSKAIQEQLIEVD